MDNETQIRLPKVEENGLSQAQIQSHIDRGETNAIKTPTSRSFSAIVRSNIFTLFNAIIAVATVMVLVAGSWKDAVFGLVIVVNAGIGIVTELRSKHALDKLSILVASRSLVRRCGQNTEIAHSEIVLGDFLWIRSGEQVPADGTILHTWGLELDESMLTGESRTVRRNVGEQIYSGSTAVSGLALVQVEAVGNQGYAAKLTAEAKVYKKTVSDLNQGINTILRYMTFLVVPLCGLLIWSQIRAVGGWDVAISSGVWRQSVVSAVAGVVGMIPEGLVLLTSLNFAIAAMRLARKNTLVQELEAVETLARVDCLNLDKTGTVTDGGISCEQVTLLRSEQEKSAVYQGIANLVGEENPNATAVAIRDYLESSDVAHGDIVERIPFSSQRKWSAVVSQEGVWYMGAPEILLAELSGDYSEIMSQVSEHADQGYRVLLAMYAQGSVPGKFADSPTIVTGAQPVALITCAESIRKDAQPTLQWFREQGVRCRIISGDNPTTVGAIAAKVQLTGQNAPRMMDARELPEDIEELAEVLEHVDVLGRVLPEQKKAIVQALHSQHHVVAMTGDGVNDALAIKEADLGIAMGNAAPATKAVAQVVLVDSLFSHLPDVVARGRQVMANMERVASLFLVKTVYSALISLGVVLTTIPFPYLPRHITYIGALTIGMPAFILALAPNTRRYIPGFLKRVVAFAFPGGVAIALSVLGAAWFLPMVLHWNLLVDSNLESLRSICAIIVFVLGIMVLAKVAQPLRSWRGVLVVAFAAAGVIGAMIPFVADFFAIDLPAGRTLIAASVALALAVVIFFVCQRLATVVQAAISHNKQTR